MREPSATNTCRPWALSNRCSSAELFSVIPEWHPNAPFGQVFGSGHQFLHELPGRPDLVLRAAEVAVGLVGVSGADVLLNGSKYLERGHALRLLRSSHDHVAQVGKRLGPPSVALQDAP